MTKMMSSIINDGIHHCKTELKEETFHCTWSIENFWKIYNFDVQLTYSIAEHNFKFSMRPNSNDTCLTFYGLISELKYPTIKCFYSIVFKTNEKIFDKRYGKCTMSQNKSTLLCDLYIASLCNQGQLVSKGTFTIYFEFHILDELINSSINHLYKTPAMTYINTDTLVSNEISKPFFVTFVVNKEQTLQANKSLLCLKSKVFKAMFDCDMKESKTNEIEITDITYNILKELLSFVQTGYLSKTIEEINLNVICELFFYSS